jgi:murein tripeptide amidase MpaA
LNRELLLALSRHLLESFRSSSRDPDPYLDRIRKLVSETDIHILPAANPDGFDNANYGDCQSAQGRANKNGQDLNRDFPEWRDHGKGWSSSYFHVPLNNH